MAVLLTLIRARDRTTVMEVDLYRQRLAEHPELAEAARRELTGKDLACWCDPDELCHADVLLEVANGEAAP